MDKLLGPKDLQFLRDTRALAPHLREITKPDVVTVQHGSIVLLHLHTDAARDWVRDNVSDEAQYFGAALVVEPRFVAHLVEGMIASGLVIA